MSAVVHTPTAAAAAVHSNSAVAAVVHIVENYSKRPLRT